MKEDLISENIIPCDQSQHLHDIQCSVELAPTLRFVVSHRYLGHRNCLAVVLVDKVECLLSNSDAESVITDLDNGRVVYRYTIPIFV